HRLYEKPPTIDDVEEYGEQMRTWVANMMPEWRRTSFGWPLSREISEGDSWDRFMRGGANGMIIMIIALSWW
ncbi:hypothetical protein DENSPDRAFT_743731, partial [Dentipellis sp. KUC8613]